MHECEINECTFWDSNQEVCEEEEVYINPETGETCCRYLEGAIPEDEYKDWYSNYEEELWDDLD